MHYNGRDFQNKSYFYDATLIAFGFRRLLLGQSAARNEIIIKTHNHPLGYALFRGDGFLVGKDLHLRKYSYSKSLDKNI